MRYEPLATFLNAPYAEDLSANHPQFVYLGIPYTTPYGDGWAPGPCSNAPDVVRHATRTQEYDLLLDHYDFDCGTTVLKPGVSIVDGGDIACGPIELNLAKREATAAVREIVEAGAIPLIVGGDDALPPIVAGGFEHTKINILHIDAHVDFRDEVCGISDGYSSPIRRLREMPQVGQIVQVGLRGIGSARAQEVRDAIAAGNRLIRATELHTMGAQSVFDTLPNDFPWFVTIDCDGLDPSVAPGVEWPEPDGVTYGEAATFVRGLAKEGRLAAIAFTEFAPEHDVRSLTALAICRLLMNVITLTPFASDEAEINRAAEYSVPGDVHV
ncbi:arginase family protein [Rhodococcus qingshengii]|uniref:arginase family protein n=1 Tax=Rhodococcus qingshengii TaxID=334542 RepID=UPI0036DB7617